MKKVILLFSLIAVIAACSSEKKSEYLPRATGNPGDMIIIMDSVQWKGELGREVRKVFMADVPGLPQSEPMFKASWVQPNKGIRLLTQVRNLVYVFTMDSNTPGSRILRQQFSQETLNKISGDSSFYLSIKKDEYSRGQDVAYLFGDTEENLIRHLQQNGHKLLDYYNRAERQRVETELFKTRSTRGVAEFLIKEQQCELRVPIGYKLADKQDDFVWLRNMTAATDKDIFITWKPYESEYQLLPDSLIAWRNEVARKYLYEDPENFESYITTEEEDANVLAKQVSLNNNFAMEIRGLWRTNNRTMGGPFIGYSLVDNARGLLYYIEGFAYAPGRDKREMMRELETILWTFRTSEEVK